MLSKVLIATSLLGLIVTPLQSQAQTNSSEANCLARVIYHEAGGESLQGQKAVGYVIINRAAHKKKFWPKTICGVINQPGQFSGIKLAKFPKSVQNRYLTLASTIISNYSVATDPTRGAHYFHNLRARPMWKGVVKTVRIGGHYFYRSRA